MRDLNAAVGFRTRYGLTVMDNTNQPVKSTVWVDNMVLDVGFATLGQTVAFGNLAIGASNTPVKATQTGLIRTVSTLPLAGGFVSHSVESKGNDVQSTLRFTLTFKKINFPQSSDTLTLSEVGLVGVTRAVLIEPLSLEYGQWVSVTVEIMLQYAGGKGSFNIPASASYQSQSIEYQITPFISNPHPNNQTASGYAAENALKGYLWSGDPVGIDLHPKETTNLTQSIVVDATNCRARLTTQGTASTVMTLKGYVVEDTIFGGGFLIQFITPITLQEDDQLSMTCSFSWAKDLS